MINFDEPFTDVYGNQIGEKPTPLYAVCVDALLGEKQGDQQSGAEKLKNYELALKIAKGGEIKLSSEEKVRIRSRAENTLTTVALGFVAKFID
jgi:hypothetical protein